MKTFAGPAAALLCTAAVLWPATAAAQEAEPWQFTGALNLFLPSVSATTIFPPPATGGSSANVNTSNLLDALKMTFMGSLEVRKGRWGAYTDVVYLDLGTTKSGSRALSLGGVELPVDVAADVGYDLKGWSWTLGGSWRAVSEPAYVLDLVGGARLLDIEQKLNWTLTGNVGPIPLPDRTGAREANLRNWDAIIGVKGRYTFGETRKWFAPYYFDIGTGDSELTTQAIAGVGYTFGWGEVVGTWRYLGYKMKSGQGLQDLSFSGPMVSAVFHW